LKRGLRFLVILGALPPCQGAAHAQAAQLDPARRDEFHQHVAELLGAQSRIRSAGDTSISWTERGPILYFTTRRSGDTLSSTLAREDGLVGSAVTTWADASQTSFHITWTRRDSIEVDMDGVVRGHELVLVRGGRDTAMALPTLPWVVADYGLEDQQVPLFRALAPSGARVAVFRPYRMKWDTVTITGRVIGEYLVIEAEQGPKVRETYILDDGARLLLLRRRDVVMERRPLEDTPLFDAYRRAVATLDSLRR
jgi:hypothetical protein